jgi:hypothetical protein
MTIYFSDGHSEEWPDGTVEIKKTSVIKSNIQKDEALLQNFSRVDVYQVCKRADGKFIAVIK